MNPDLGERIAQLRRMTTAELQLKYRELFGQASHSNRKDYLFRRVAWRVQALAEEGLSERARQYAQEMADGTYLRLCAPNKLVGAQPTRQVARASWQRYKDETITVTVLDDGYEHKQRYTNH